MKECSVVLSLLRHILCGKSSQSTQRTIASSFFLLPHSLLYTITQEVLRRALKLYCMSAGLCILSNEDYCVTTYTVRISWHTFSCIGHKNLAGAPKDTLCSILTGWLSAGFTGL